MTLYRKKPVVIEAVQWTGDNVEDIMRFTEESFDRFVEFLDGGFVKIETLEGTMTANPGDFIIRGVKGEFYPCKPDIFKQTYEIVPEIVPERVNRFDRLKSLDIEKFVQQLINYDFNSGMYYSPFSGKHHTEEDAIRQSIDYLSKEYKQ